MPNYMSLTLRQAAEVTLDAWEADPKAAPFWIGPPGIGKTQVIAGLAGEIAQKLWPQLIASKATVGGQLLTDPRTNGEGLFPSFDFAPLEIAHGADEDIGGIPVRDAVTGAVQRLPIGPLARASHHPTINLYDEVSRAKAQKQGTILTLANERRAGDFVLHPGSRNVLAANGVDSSGTHSVIDALLNRCLLMEIRADVDEFLAYLMSVGAPGSTLNELCIDYAMTAKKAPGLVELTPPANATENGNQWASPRAIEKALKVFDTSLKNKRTGEVLTAGLAGCIGDVAAGKYLAIRQIRDRLPSVDQIVGNPKGALVPDAADIEVNIGLMGLVGVAASRNADAAWIYNSRILAPESRTALSKALCAFPPKSPEARMTKMRLLGEVGVASEA